MKNLSFPFDPINKALGFVPPSLEISSNLSCSVLVFGHISPSFLQSLTYIPANNIFAVNRPFRIIHTISLLSDINLRVDFARSISSSSNHELFSFLDSKYSSCYAALAENELDRGLDYSRSYLDTLERDDIKHLSLLVAFELISRLPQLPKYAVIPHEPHGLSDLSIYFALRHLGVHVYSFRWIAETSSSFIVRDIYEGHADPYSLSTPHLFVRNIDPVPSISTAWYQSAFNGASSGNWKYCIDAAQNGDLTLLFPSAIKKKNISSYLYDMRAFILLNPTAKIKRWCRRPSLLADDALKNILRRVNLFVNGYENKCLPPDHIDLSSSHQYVYVPFNLQPESTTTCFGMSYVNPVHFLRKVRFLVGPSVKIYVKDHPAYSLKHFAYSRPKCYHRYLKSLIPELYFVSGDILSKDIIKNSMCTFTVNGTACIEAALVGKPAVFGGLSFFASLPNVSHIDSFKSSADFTSWLKSARQISSSNPGIKAFYTDREPFIHNCVAYGTIGQNHGQFDKNFPSAFASIQADYTKL